MMVWHDPDLVREIDRIEVRARRNNRLFFASLFLAATTAAMALLVAVPALRGLLGAVRVGVDHRPDVAMAMVVVVGLTALGSYVLSRGDHR